MMRISTSSHLPSSGDRPTPGTGDRRWILLMLSVGLLAVLPYVGILDSPYVFDDVKLVRDNMELRSQGEGDIGDIAATFDVTSRKWSKEELRANYRPLRFLSYRLDYYLSTVFIGDFNPAKDPPPVLFFHLQNIFWHALNAMLVFLLGRCLLGSSAAGFLAALIFALHPAQTEAVTYISSRRDVLSTFFFLASLSLYLAVPREKEPNLGVLLLGASLFSLGLLAKEMVITLPAVLALVDLSRRPVLGPRRLAFHAILWVVALTFAIITLTTPGLVASGGEPRGFSMIYDAGRYAVRYLELLLFPLSQSIDYSYAAITESRGLFDPLASLLSLALVLSLVLAAIRSYRKGAGLAGLAILWFLGTLVPVLQLVPIAERFAEHFVYLPSIGIALLAGCLLRSVLGRSDKLGWAVGLSLAASCLFLTVRRNSDWESRESLWASAVKAQPQCARARFEYANALIEKGGRGPADAMVEFDKALEIWDGQPVESYHGYKLRIHAQRGLVHSSLGKTKPGSLRKAIDELRLLLSEKDIDGSELSVSTNSILLSLRLELASCLERGGEENEALSEYRKVIELDNDSTMALRARFQLHQILLRRKDIDGAVSVLAEIPPLLKRNSGDWLKAQLLLFTVLLEHKKDFDSAAALIEGLLRSASGDEEKVGFLLRLAQVFDRQGNLDACVEKLEEALQIKPDSVAVLESLAPIESMRNRTERAEDYFSRLLKINPANSIGLQGLKEIRLRKDAGPAKGAKQLEAQKLLESMEETARGHEARKQWPAARQSWSHIIEKAAETGATDRLAQGYRGMARCEAQLRRKEEALKYLEKALETGSARSATFRALADLHLRYLGKPAKAADYYRRHIAALGSESKVDPGVYLNLARIISSDSAEESVDFFEKAVDLGILEILGPDSAGVKKDMGLLYVKLGRWQQAFESLSGYHESLGAEKAADRLVIEEILNEHVLPNLVGEQKKKDGGR